MVGLRVRIPPWYGCRECFVVSGRGLCEGLITLPEESYRACEWVREREGERSDAIIIRYAYNE